MSLEEWSSYRERELIHGNTLMSWLALLAGKESRKFLLYNELKSIISIDKPVVDFGCGQSHIGILLKVAGFEVLFSDADDTVLPAILSEFKTSFLKYSFPDVGFIPVGSTVLLTQVDYIFSKDELEGFLTALRKKSCEVIFINTQISGPFGLVRSKLLFRSRLANSKLKRHGFKRTLGTYNKLGKLTGFSAVKIFRSDTIELKSYYFIHFSF